MSSGRLFSQRLNFQEMTGDSAAMDLYEFLAAQEMDQYDLVSAQQLNSWVLAGEARAWMTYTEDGTLIGWCSIMTASGCHPAENSAHLLGNIVFGDNKGRGFGKEMVQWRVEQFGTAPLTASVQPGNLSSERALAASGFRKGLPGSNGPWIVWHRPSTNGRDLLVRWHEGLNNSEQATVEMAATDIIQSMRQRGWYVEAISDKQPTVSARSCPYAAWPDPAAFHTVIDLNGNPSSASESKEHFAHEFAS